MNHKSIVAELQTKYWAMDEHYLNAFVAKFENVDFAKLKKEQAAHDDMGGTPPISFIDGDRAVIQVTGMLVKEKPWYFDAMDIQATEFSQIRKALDRALANETISEIILYIDSGGGEVGGTKELSDYLYRSDMSKPIDAFINDMGASGAYWLASSCRSITINDNGQAGSIGVYTVREDSSKAYEDAGIKVHVIKNGDFKGSFTDGTEITEQQIKNTQEIIDGLALSFHESVQRGRPLSLEQVQELGTGQVWLASQALSLGLVDAVNSWENYLNGVAQDPINSSHYRSKQMAEETKAEVVEIDQEAIKAEGHEAGKSAELNRFKDLKAAFPENEAFATAQFEVGADVQTAKLAYLDVLKAELDETKTELAEAKAISSNATETTGAEPIAHGEPATGTKSDYEQAKDYAAENNCSFRKAMSAISAGKRGK